MITQELLHELFEYRDGVLYWKVSRSNRIKIGDAAGSLNKKSYLQTSIEGKRYYNHRLIFLMFKGFLTKYIDHSDGNTLNNSIENLRAASASQNNFNQGMRSNNTSGVKGVSWCNASNKWKAEVRANGKYRYLGVYKDLELAELVVEEARNKYHGEYANHGNQNEKDCS